MGKKKSKYGKLERERREFNKLSKEEKFVSSYNSFIEAAKRHNFSYANLCYRRFTFLYKEEKETTAEVTTMYKNIVHYKELMKNYEKEKQQEYLKEHPLPLKKIKKKKINDSDDSYDYAEMGVMAEIRKLLEENEGEYIKGFEDLDLDDHIDIPF